MEGAPPGLAAPSGGERPLCVGQRLSLLSLEPLRPSHPAGPEPRGRGSVLVGSPCLRWVRTGQGPGVVGLLPGLSLQRLPKGLLLSRPISLGHVLLHKEHPSPRPPPLTLPWRVPLPFGTPAPGEAAGGSFPPPRTPPSSGYSRGVYDNFRRWQRYKDLARAQCPRSPDNEALACFFIPVLRSLSQFRPELRTEEGVPLAVQEWCRLSNFDRMIYYEMAEKFMEFELEENAQRPTADPVPAPTGVDPGARLVSAVTGKAGKQSLEDAGRRKAGGKGGSQRSQRLPKPAVSGPATPQPIPLEAVDQYIAIMEALDLQLDLAESVLPEALEERGEEETELLGYIERLCTKDSFISKTETIIHTRFLSNLLSPNRNIDFPQLLRDLETEQSPFGTEDRPESAQAVIGRPSATLDPQPPTSPLTPVPKAAQPLSGLLLPPLKQDGPYSSRLQLLALQSSHSSPLAFSSGESQALPGPVALPQPPLLRDQPSDSPQGDKQPRPHSPGVLERQSQGPVTWGDRAPALPCLAGGERLASPQNDGQAKERASAAGLALSGSQSQSKDSTGAQAQSKAPPGAQAQSKATTGPQVQNKAPTGPQVQSKAPPGAQAQSRTPTGPQAQSRAPTRVQAQSKAPTGAQAQSKAPTGAQAKSKASTGAQAQSKATTGPEAQSKAPTGAQAQCKAPIEHQAESKASTGAQVQSNALPGAQGQRKAPSGAQGQSKAPSGAQGQSKALAPAQVPGGLLLSWGPLLEVGDFLHGPRGPENGYKEDEGPGRPEDKPPCPVPQRRAGCLGPGTEAHPLRHSKVPQEGGPGPQSPAPRVRARGEKRRQEGGVRRSKRTRKD